MTINLSDTVAPLGGFPIVNDTDLLGGMRSVVDITARDAIPIEGVESIASRRKEGMLVYVQSDGVIYQLTSGLTNADWVQLSPAISRIPFSDEASTLYTFQLVDAGTRKRFTAGTAVTATVPPIVSVAWQPGQVIYGIQLGAGLVTLAQGAGVTVNAPPSFSLAVLGQYAQFSLVHEGSDVWTLGGTLSFI